MVLRALGMWSVAPTQLSGDEAAQLEASLGTAVDAAAGAAVALPAGVAAVDALRWLAQERPVLFHGTGRGDLETLSPVRQSSDTSAFGNQQAVFATQDPVWAMFFAVLDRSNPEFRSTRNGASTVIGGRREFGPRYFFAVNDAMTRERMWRPGVVYVVDRKGFMPDARDLGVIDNAQWASVAPVKWLAKVRVTPEDFPFRNATFGYRTDESELRTFARIRRAGKRR